MYRINARIVSNNSKPFMHQCKRNLDKTLLIFWSNPEQSQIGILVYDKNTYLPSYVRTMFWVTILYTYVTMVAADFIQHHRAVRIWRILRFGSCVHCYSPWLLYTIWFVINGFAPIWNKSIYTPSMYVVHFAVWVHLKCLEEIEISIKHQWKWAGDFNGKILFESVFVMSKTVAIIDIFKLNKYYYYGENTDTFH